MRDTCFVEFVPELRLAHMEEVAEHDRRRRALERACERAVVVRVDPALAYEIGELRILEVQRIDLLR